MMRYIYRKLWAVPVALLLAGFSQVSPHPDFETESKPNVQRIKYTEEFLKRLSASEGASIEHNPLNNSIVLEMLIQLGEYAKIDSHCKLTADSEFFGYFVYSIGRLKETMGRREGVNYAIDLGTLGQTKGWILSHDGCGNQTIQRTLANAVEYALGDQELVPYELNEDQSVVSKPRFAFVDYYCRRPGRYDPECAKLVGFMKGRPEPSCADGLMIPAAPKPPNIVYCVYEMPISRDTRRNFNRIHSYWHQRVPDNLDSLRVYGVDQFSSIAPVAVEACPTDHRVAARLSGDRHGTPITGFPGEMTGMPEPSNAIRNPRCEEVRVARPAATPEDPQETENRRDEHQGPAITTEETEGAAGWETNFTGEYQVTSSGLRYGVLHMGNGAKPTVGSSVRIHYRGSLQNGTEFDNSYARNEPISISLSRAIRGWREGLQLMPEGSKFIFKIPPDLAYGEQGGGPIPPNSMLIFEMELLAIEN